MSARQVSRNAGGVAVSSLDAPTADVCADANDGSRAIAPASAKKRKRKNSLQVS
jgi:hypothetical protein